jgi:hypothetical protein
LEAYSSTTSAKQVQWIEFGVARVSTSVVAAIGAASSDFGTSRDAEVEATVVPAEEKVRIEILFNGLSDLKITRFIAIPRATVDDRVETTILLFFFAQPAKRDVALTKVFLESRCRVRMAGQIRVPDTLREYLSYR